MSNQLQTKAASLAQILAANRLTKSAEQEIEHKGLLDQTNLGKEQTQEIHQNVDGVNADTPAADNPPKENVQEVPGAQSLNAAPEQALSNSGTTVNTITPDGNTTGTPAEQAKSAADYRQQLAGILAAMNKKASAEAPKAEAPAQEAAQATQEQQAKQASAQEDNFRTGMEVLEKFASLTPNSTAEDIAAAKDDLVKLASSNPVFRIARDRIMMEKMSADIDALAEAEGISPDQAAAELQAAADGNPEMMAELESEADGEAVAELADAEAATDQLMGDIQGMADNASNALGVEVTPDDIINASEETVQLAEELGVPPEVLIQQAMAELNGAGAGEPEVSPEDEANAQKILDEAAANGISPEEVIQMAASELGGDAAAAGEPAPAEVPAEGAPVEKAASLQKRAGTMRAAFVQELRHQNARG